MSLSCTHIIKEIQKKVVKMIPNLYDWVANFFFNKT